MHGLGNQIIAHAHCLRAFSHARDSLVDCHSTWCHSRWQEGVPERPQWTTV